MSKIQRVNIGGKPFRLCVFRIDSWDENGVPERLTHIPEDRTAELSTNPDHNHFMLVWCSVVGVAPNPTMAGKGGDV